MTNALAINITAADRVTKVLQNINKNAERMSRPFQNMQRSIQRFGKAAGFDTVKRKLEGLTQTARGVVSAFARIGAPLLALVGGGTIAGLIALTNGWARFGLKISQTSQILGVNTQDLYNFQNAAQLVGISGAAATQTFSAFADTLQDARWGRNQPAMGLLLGLGIHLKSTKAGAIDSMDALGQVADKIQYLQKIGNTGGARTIARQLGITELMPFLMGGRKAMEAYEAQAQKLAGSIDWNMARAAGLQWERMNVAMMNTKNTISAALLPTIAPLIEQFGSWISANRQLIATNIGDFVKSIGQAFKGISLKGVLDDILAVVQAMLTVAKAVNHVTASLGGVKTVLEDLAGLWAVNKVLRYGMAFLKVSAWTDAARRSLLSYRAASVVKAGGETVASRSAAVAAGGFRVASIASMAVPAIGAGLIANTLWDGKIGNIDYNSWSGLFSSMGLNKIVAAPMAPSIMGYFQRQGWTAAQAAGIAANLQAESGFNPRSVGDNGQARGIAQWHPLRQAGFNAWAQKNKLADLAHAELPEQLQYEDYELRHSDAGRRLAGATNAFDAASIVSLYGERPANGQEEADRRGALATQIAAQAAQVNVNVQTTVQRDGATTTKVQTPAGVKVVHTNPADSVS